MDQVDDLTKNVLVDIINNLEVQPRAQIVKLYYLEHRSENAIALQLNLPKTVVQNHIQLFKVLLANTLEEEPSQFQRSSCYLC